MAGIIVAIVVFLVVVTTLLFIKLEAKSERKVLRNFYDILFLTKFFNELSGKNITKKVLRDGETIFITRKFLMNQKNVKSSDYVFQQKNNICYIFKINGEIFEIYDFLDKKHKKLIPLFLNTKFKLEINRNKIDLHLNELFSEFICVKSEKTIVQSIWILLESICDELKGEYFFFCTREEIEATQKIVEKTKDVLSRKISK